MLESFWKMEHVGKLRAGRDQYFKVLQAREIVVSMRSRKIGKAGKTNDGNEKCSLDSLTLYNPC